jgi:thiol:disulfide interchange protein DsbD
MAQTLRSSFARSTLLALALLSPGLASAAETAAVTSPRVTATILSSRDTVAPGERFQVALVQRIAPGWHTYWQNPGDSGEATRIDWVLPAGMTAGEIQWPAPKALPVEPLLNFGFEGTVLLPVEIAVPETARPGERLTLKANATWLVCEKICIPEEGAFTLELPVGPASVVDEAAQSRIEAARAALPQPAGFRGRLAADGDKLALSLPGLAGAPADLRFFPISDTLIEHAAPQAAASAADGATLQLARSSAFKLESAEIEGVITFTEGGVSRALTLSTDADPALVTAATGAATGPGPAVLRLPAAGEGAGLTFWAALAFAFAGGLILNLMPCVLPVLFIKAIGFVQLARSSRAEVREQGLLFLCGVLATFLVLAGTVIAFAALGSSVGWGYQLQSPPVVIAPAEVPTSPAAAGGSAPS